MPSGSANLEKSLQKASNYPNVDPTDYIKKADGPKFRLYYRTKCNNCASDRGYQRLTWAVRPYCLKCLPCGQYERSEEQKRAFVERIKALPSRRGYKHTEETKALLSVKIKAYCAEHGNAFAGLKHTEATKAILSDKNSKREPQWKGRTFQYNGPKGYFKMRSSWELAYANWLDLSGIDWLYEPKFRLSNGRSFCPDFELKDGTIVEIKGFWTEKAKLKWSLFLNDYPNLKTKVLEKKRINSLRSVVTWR